MQQNIPCRPIFFRKYSDNVVERAVQDRILASMDAPLPETGLGEAMQKNGHSSSTLGLSRANFNNNTPGKARPLCSKPCLSAPRQLPAPAKSRLPGYQV